MGEDGHGWVCMGANEYIGVGEHKKETKGTMNGREWSYTVARGTIKNRDRNRLTHNRNRGEGRGIRGAADH